MADAAYEVRITPLIRGVPGQPEWHFVPPAGFSANPAGTTEITLADTVLVEQFSDLEVHHPLNDGRTGSVTLSMHDPLVATLKAYQHAIWIGYQRPGATLAEGILFAQCNVIDDFEAEQVILAAHDPTARCQHQYFRRGDTALNVSKNKGSLPAHAYSLEEIVHAARNTPEQQLREVPALAMHTSMRGFFVNFDAAAPMEIERGQEVWDLVGQITRMAGGPDIDVQPAWSFPSRIYARLSAYDAPTNPAAPEEGELGRNLDPVDPDAPAAGDVVFDHGLGQDNVEKPRVEPGRPTTHVHVLDADREHRITSADVASSAEVGVWVDWVEADFKVERPEPIIPGVSNTVPDTSPLKALADARIRAYGKPPNFFTLTLRPDDAQSRHYGHPEWAAANPAGGPGGDWYIGDYVRVRANRGFRSFSTLARIVDVTFRQADSNGLPQVDILLIPAIGGTPGRDPEAAVFVDIARPVVTMTAPASGATVMGTAVSLTATATASSGAARILHVEFLLNGVVLAGSRDTEAPYVFVWNTTTVADGYHHLTARATDSSGRIADSTVVRVYVGNTSAQPAVSDLLPPAGGFFATVLPGQLNFGRTDAQAAALVNRSTWEPRPTNTTANHTVPPAGTLTGDDGGGTNWNLTFGRITGNFVGTTDEIIQWVAIKWGISDEIIRAMLMNETNWYQDRKDAGGVPVPNQGYGDYGHCSSSQVGSPYGDSGPASFGLPQVKWCSFTRTDGGNPPNQGGYPWIEWSSAFALDFWGATVRRAYEGWSYMGDQAKGDIWGSMGRWFSGDYNPSQQYVTAAQNHHANKPWLQPGF